MFLLQTKRQGCQDRRFNADSAICLWCILRRVSFYPDHDQGQSRPHHSNTLHTHLSALPNRMRSSCWENNNNFEVLRTLFLSLAPSIKSFFQSLGKLKTEWSSTAVWKTMYASIFFAIACCLARYNHPCTSCIDVCISCVLEICCLRLLKRFMLPAIVDRCLLY